MAINLKFDLMGNPEPPSIVLANRNGNKLGQLNVNVESIDISDKFNTASEFSFTLNKYIDGEPTPLWNKVVNFKLVYCPEWDMWFEIKVELDETTETIKTVFCTQLGQAELSQIKVYNIHINEEGDPNWDTNNETYKSTVLCDKEHTDVSLLHRLLKDKAPHYSIDYVDPTIQRIQRQFSFDDTSICDAFDEIAEEIGCLFVYNSNSTKGGKPSRTISVYDLQQNCKDCGHRGEFTDKCPKCESTNIDYGYGEDTTIFVTSDELATEGIQLVTDTDSVKNCFKLEGGDDLMTATIRNCNPNGSDYIWYFSDALKEDMSKELVEKLESYNEKYQDFYNNHISKLNNNLVAQYNALVEKYDDYYNTKSTCLSCGHEDYFQEQCPNCNSKNILAGQKLQTIPTTITGYPNLLTAHYNTIDLLLYLKSGLMPKPDIEADKTSAEEQVALLTTSSLSPVAVNVKEAKDISDTTSKSAVLSMAKVLIKSTYKVEAETLSFNNVTNADGEVVAKTWEGKFTVTNYSDNTDTATSDNISVTVNNDTKTFIEQKIKKTLNKGNTDDYSITGLFAKEYDDFCAEIKKYALNPLDNFSKACDDVISILTEQGVGDDGNNEDDELEKEKKKALYDALYKPYFDKQQAINDEIKVRENEIVIIEGVWDKSDENNPKCTTWGLQQYIEKCQQDIQEVLDFEAHLGEDLWLEFCAYRREDKYSNSNYISDGLDNAELFKKANEFIEVAEEEIFKSAELQHSISATLNNLLSLPKFKPLLKSFKTGNWIRVQVDDKVYKLRLLEYGFGYGDSKSISVEFSDVTKIKNGVTDVKEVLEQASSMASSYDSVQRQAEKGNVARSTIDQWLVDGLNAANTQITSNDNEEVLLTKSGLLARSYDDITGTYSPEQLKITHNIMAYTDDNWKTVRQSIGKHSYKYFDQNKEKLVDKIGYGMNADFANAAVLCGSQMIGGDIYSNNYTKTVVDGETITTGSHIDLEEGHFSLAGGKLKYDGGDLTIVGKIEVTTSGRIGCWDINETSIYKDSAAFGDANGMYFGTSGLSLGDDFKVESSGLATMTNANVSGTITASDIIGGTITGTEIKGGTITAGDTLYIGSQKDDDGNIIANSHSAWIDVDGVLHTNDAHINGTITAIDGMIGRFIIKPTESGGWLYSGESIGSDKSIFLSATDMSGTMPFAQLTAITDENGDIVFDDNGDVTYTTTSNDLYKEDWRITVGENFGVTSDGTAYMSNCEIVGGSLKMGTETDGYHTWISEDGILHAWGVNVSGTINAINGTIGGWDIINDGIVSESGDVGMIASDKENYLYPSLVNDSESAPVRFYAGNDGSEKMTVAQEIYAYYNSNTGRCEATYNALYPIDNVQLVRIDDHNGNEIMPQPNTDFRISYSKDKTSFDLSFYIGISNNYYVVTVEYDYSFAFCVLEDGSLYASNAKITGEINATKGTFKGEVIANSGFIGGLQIQNNGIFSGDDGLSFDKGGIVKTQQLHVSGDFSAATMRTSSIKGRYSDDVNLTFESQSVVMETVSFSTKITVVDSGSNNWLGNVKEEGSAKVKLIADKQLTETKTFQVHLGYVGNGYSTGETVYMTISAGSNTSEVEVVNRKQYGVGCVLTRVVAPENIEQPTANTAVQNIVCKGGFIPASPDSYLLGNSNQKWKEIWCTQSAINSTSDRNEKNSIEILPSQYDNFFDQLKPVRYKFNQNESNRFHIGFIAQDVKEALDSAEISSSDFAGYIVFDKEDGSKGYGLRYGEFIALNTHEIQQLKKRVIELENKLKTLENK